MHEGFVEDVDKHNIVTEVRHNQCIEAHRLAKTDRGRQKTGDKINVIIDIINKHENNIEQKIT